MRVFSNNIFNKYLKKVNADNLSDECNLDDAFSSGLNSKIKFNENTEVGSIVLSDIDESINTFSFFKCNARFVEIKIICENDEQKYYPVHINNDVVIVNIEEIKIKDITISFIKNKESIECKFLMAGLGFDFPPHSPKKTHSLNYTHEQFFSQSGHHFARHLPMKKYDTWVISFELLRNKDKELIVDFFESINFEPFLLQVWKESIASERLSSDVVKEFSSNLFLGLGFAFGSPFSKIKKEQKDIFYTLKSKLNKIKPKYEMKSGFYVVTNKKLDFKKSDNGVYQWSTSLTFRECFNL